MKTKMNYFRDKSETRKRTGYPGGIYLMIVIFIFILNGCEEKPTGVQTSVFPLKDDIQLTMPSNLADSVVVDPVLLVTFKQGTDTTIVTSTTIILKNGATIVPGYLSYTGTTASFKSMNDLSPESEYTATIKLKSHEGSGSSEESGEYSWRFKTGRHHSYNSLKVVSKLPLNNAIDVPVNIEPSVIFNIDITTMMKSQIHIYLRNGTNFIDGSLTFLNKTATFKPTASLEQGKIYVGKVTIGPDGEKDDDSYTSGNNFTWSFTTAGSTVDVTAPKVSSVVPANNSTSVAATTGATVTFSEAMNPVSINSSIFTLKQGTINIAGTVTSAGSTAKFTPSLPLEANKVYTATILKGAKDLAGNVLAADYSWSFTTTSATDVVAPKVVTVLPAANATSVATTSKVIVTFSEAMTAATLNSSTFTLKLGSVSVPGTVSLNGAQATFAPSVALLPASVYTSAVTTGVMDASGNALAATYNWNFTTAALTDVTPPTVSSVVPLANSTSIAVNANPSVTFSEAMATASVTPSTFTLKQGSATVSGTVSLSGSTATFKPSAALSAATVYTVMVTTGVKDISGNALAAAYTWNFTTLAASDVTSPSVSSVSPSANSTSIAVNAKPSVTFSEAMNALTITASTFTMKQGSATVTGNVTYSGSTATFTPSVSLAMNTVYTCTITTGAKDLAGNALLSNYSWSFTTVVPLPAGKSFSADVVPILGICNTCHNHPWTTSSNASTFYSNLVNGGYVNPTTPTSGKIYTKLSGGHPGSTVTTAQVNTILTWMTEGSKNN